MSNTPLDGERYVIREKLFKFLGNAFHIYGEGGSLVGYCKQRAFKLREDITIYTDESKSHPLVNMKARQVIDFAVTYDVTLPTGESLGSIRRRGMKSLLRDAWSITGPAGEEVAGLTEDSGGAAFARRFVPGYTLINPAVLHIDRLDTGTRIATLAARRNPFISRLGVTIDHDDEQVDDLIVLAAGCLYMIVRAQQRDND
jgi:uncharacterized protein YxjI